MPVQITTIEFRGRIEGSPRPLPEAESNDTQKAAERERLVAAAVAETLAVMRRREER
jgi:hypothetical protein